LLSIHSRSGFSTTNAAFVFMGCASDWPQELLAQFRPADYLCVVTIRVLLAEDNLHMAGALQAVLSQEPGIEVAAVAGNGDEAVRLADELLPDVVVLDRAMPGVDGIAAMRQIRECHPATPVLILTATTDVHVAESALAAGASGFVAKDTAFEELGVAIRTVFEKKVYLSSRLGRKLVP
jgi:DNA-binding NarL/FixJ family response regulator